MVNALTFLPLIAVTWATHPHEARSRGRGQPGQLRAALRAVRTTGALRRPIRSVAAISLIAAPVGQLLPAIASQLDPAAGAASLGFVTAAFAAGSTLVVVAVDRLRAWLDRPGLVEVSFLTASVVMTASGVLGLALGAQQVGLWATTVLLLVPVGLAIAVCQSATSAILQTHAPAPYQGAVFALYGVAFTALAPLGALTLGRLAESLEVWAVITLDGALLCAYAAYLLWDLRRARRRHEIPPPPHRSVRAHTPHWGSAVLLTHASHRRPLTAGGGEQPGGAGGGGRYAQRR